MLFYVVLFRIRSISREVTTGAISIINNTPWYFQQDDYTQIREVTIKYGNLQ
jgi:hypothetical protein